MDYENFKEQFVNDVKEKLYEQGTEVDITVNTVNKLNESYEAMTVKPEGSNIGVNIGIDKFFGAVEDGTSYGDVVDKAVKVIADGFANQPQFDIASLSDYDQMKDKLVMEVVSAETNKDMLENVPHKNIEDMAVVYRFVLNSDEEGRASILATNQMIENYGITAEQLHADALENAPRIKPAEIKGMGEVLAEMMGIEQAEMMGLYPVRPEDEQIFVASVPDKVHGAGVLAYQDFMDQAAERAGGECLGLRWEDLDFEKRIISVNHSIVYRYSTQQKNTTINVSLPKTEAGIREIPMLPVVKDAFDMEKEDQAVSGGNTQVIDGMSGFVFCNRFHKVHNPQTVNDTIRRICKNYNAEEALNAKKEKREAIILPDFSCHHLRHTFATRLCETETNLKVIQDIMGHKDIQTTMNIYAEATRQMKQQSFENLASKLDDIF